MNMTWQEKFREIYNSPLFPTAPDCPYCDYKSDYQAKTGICHHVKSKHPDKYHKKVDVLINFVESLMQRSKHG